jgi:hypothetical protein
VTSESLLSLERTDTTTIPSRRPHVSLGSYVSRAETRRQGPVKAALAHRERGRGRGYFPILNHLRIFATKFPMG